MTAVNGHRMTPAEAKTYLAALPASTFEVTATDSGDPVAESERAVLGTMIQSSGAAQEAMTALRPEYFAYPAHQHVFEAVMRLADAGNPVEPAAVMAELARAGTLTKVGAPNLGVGGTFLASLMERAGSVGYHAAKVLEEWQRRNTRLVLAQCRQMTDNADWDPDYHLDEIRKRVMDATAYAGTSVLRPNSETVTEVLDAVEAGEEPGLTTGYGDLDEAIGGLRPGELIVVGARPGQGKTLLGLCIADHVGTRLGLPVLFSSLEMREEELTRRRIAALARVPLVNLVRNQASDDDWHRISCAHDRLAVTELRVDDTPRQSPAYIKRQLRAMDRTGCRARLLVIDYLGFMAAPKAESRQQAVAELARQVKEDIAREFGIPVILLCQLNRLVESRSDRRPVLSDLRESGEIEQSADIVILLHREDAYEPESPRAGEIDLIVRKNRQGAQCTATLAFQGHYGRIVSMAPGDSPPAGEWSPSGRHGQ
jgi:replicative DNA helicase